MILATDEDTKVKDAVALRFKELCEERNISPNALAVRSGVTPSTVYRCLIPLNRASPFQPSKNCVMALELRL